MFTAFFLFELRYHLKRLSTYVYFGLFFLIGFLVMNAAGGAFDSLTIGGGGGKINANAPAILHNLISFLSYFGIIITSAIVGSAVYRDYEYNTHSLFYTKPISKVGYLGGRFTGSVLIVLLIFTSIALGMMLGSFMPWLDQERFGPFRLMAYIQPYLTSVIPNLIFTGALFFALATLTRNIFINYVTSIIFLLGYLVAVNLIANIDNKMLASLIDPFGNIADGVLTQYWTVAERNTRLVPLADVFLYNRLLWTGIGIAIFSLTSARFTFAQFASTFRKNRKTVDTPVSEDVPSHMLVLPRGAQSFSLGDHFSQFAAILRREFTSIIKSTYFIAIVFAGVLFLFISASQMGSLYGTTVYPVTYSVLELAGGSFSLFILIIITFYAGELIWRERELRINQMIDAMPVQTWSLFTGKLGALMLVQVVLLGVIMGCGILFQIAKGYFNFEVGVYIRYLFGLKLIDYILLCFLAMVIHVVVNHKYTGHFLLVLYYLVTIFLPQFGFEHNLYNYGSDPGLTYSDMNGFGPFVGPYFWFKLYWAAFAVLLALLSNILWVRGTEDNWRARLQFARQRISRPVTLTAIAAGVLFVATGGFIFYNTNILNTYQTSSEREEQTALYEKKYRHFNGIPQPRITNVKVDVDIYPGERRADMKGRYILVNKTSVPVDSIHINMVDWITIHSMTTDRPSTVVLADKPLGYYIYKLASPLQPGDSLSLLFDIAYLEKGFENDRSKTEVVENGTFFNSGYMPNIGYSEDAELSDDDTRKKHGLQPKPRMAAVNDIRARANTYISNSADWIQFESTVSTSPDQIAIAPGYLQKEWTQNGRRYFHYKMDAPILNFYSFLSARYQVRRDTWKDVAIEVYYHKGHEYNVDRMIGAVKKSLDYYTRNFSPYQHRQVRIIEFPRYASFAQSFPNTIPYSESIGFIAKVDDTDPDDIDYPFYVTAHEVAHQWWAHQVIGGNVQGATLLSESMAQYSALMVMEKEYGKDKMRKFLKYELDSYLRARGMERKGEMPLYLVENQQYIHYNKGSLALYALRDYLGEEQLNHALAGYIRQVAFQEPPYTNSIEFLNALKAATPDSLQYVIHDMLETITLYENKVTDVRSTKQADGTYRVHLTVESKKVRSNELGNETDVALNDWIDIGVFGKDDKGAETELYLAKLTKPTTEFDIVVKHQPDKAGIDPYNKLIDRHSSDNVKTIGPKS
jgi:ABC-2 type transport system permease protein